MVGRGTPDRVTVSAHVAPALQRVLDRLDTPAVVLSCLGEPLVANALGVALFGDRSRATGWERSEFYRWFMVDAERELYPEQDREQPGRAVVASLRAAYGLLGARSRAGELVRLLQERSAEFAALWDRHEVARRFEAHMTLVHPVVGPIELDCQALFTEDQTQSLLVLTAAPRSPDAAKLELLAVVGQQEMAQSR